MENLRITGKNVSDKVRTDFIKLKEDNGHENMGETLKFLLDFYEKRKFISAPNLEKNSNLNALGRIDLFVNTIMKHNEKKGSDKFFIGASFVRKELGVNMQALNNYFKDTEAKLNVHHKKNNITKYENYKFRSSSKIYKDIFKRGEDKRMIIVANILKENNVYDKLTK